MESFVEKNPEYLAPTDEEYVHVENLDWLLSEGINSY